MAEQPANPVGRPSKYQARFCDDVIEWHKQGGSLASFNAYLYEKYVDKGGEPDKKAYVMAVDTVYGWKETHQEFSEAVKSAEGYARKFYEDLSKAGMTGNLRRVSKETIDPDGRRSFEYEPASFSAATWIFTMKNRFKWKDRQEHQVTGKDGESLNWGALAKQTISPPAEVTKDPKVTE